MTENNTRQNNLIELKGPSEEPLYPVTDATGVTIKTKAQEVLSDKPDSQIEGPLSNYITFIDNHVVTSTTGDENWTATIINDGSIGEQAETTLTKLQDLQKNVESKLAEFSTTIKRQGDQLNIIWNAINSGAGTGLQSALDSKQDKLTFDTTPTANSSNPVTSGGVKTALASKQDTLTFDTTPTAGSTKPVTSGGVKTALDGKANTSHTHTIANISGLQSALDGKASTSSVSAKVSKSGDTMTGTLTVPNLNAATDTSQIGTAGNPFGAVWADKLNNNAVTDSANQTLSVPGASSIVGALNQMMLKIYPVGAVYISTNSTSPASLFGGTWEQIQNRFLLACGSSYANGSTGGEATHTLTINEMPSHDHGGGTGEAGDHNHTFGVGDGGDKSFAGYPDINDAPRKYDSSTDSAGKHTHVIPSQGGGEPHNNMPPYLAVYVWKRTA